MNFHSTKSKIILFSVISVLLIIVFFPEIKKMFANGDDHNVKAKHTRTGTDASSNFEQTKSRMAKEVERDVSSYSFNEFLKNQVEKDVGLNQNFEEEEKFVESIPEPEEKIVTAPPSTSGASQKSNTSPPTYTPPIQVKKEIEENNNFVAAVPQEPQRRVGFSGSGSGAGSSTNNISSSASATNTSSSIKAVINQSKKIKNGDIILIRTTQEFTIQNKKIPVNTLLSGNISFSGSRMNILINAIPYGNETISCNLSAYDLDGNKGLKMDRDLSYELKGDATNAAISEATRVVNVPYVGNLTRNIAQKTANDPTVTVEQGQEMILRFN